jgi:hypothetical protein
MDAPVRSSGLSHTNELRSRVDANGRARPTVFVPALLIALAIVVWFGFQTVQLVREWGQLSVAQSSLQPQEQNAIKLRASLDAVATSTVKLAAEGNGNARVVVEELRKRGVTINLTDAPKAK